MPLPAAQIAVCDLQIGMYVHLDLGWTAHPFPLSSFRITRAEQIGTIRDLGLVRVRWSPEKSELATPVPTPEAAAADLPSVPPPQHEEVSRQPQREALKAQSDALLRCERQLDEARQAWDETNALLLTEPAVAHDRGKALTRALLDKMAPERNICIRALTDAAGTRASTHALNVGVLSLLMGRVFGFSGAEMMDLGLGALMHDVGKLALTPRLRDLDDGFSAAEISHYRDHVALGVARGRSMGLAPGVLLVIAQHHEHADGTGFPQRIGVDRMTPAARIVALVNRYDNLCNPVQPSRSLTPHEALSQMFAQGKHTFDLTMLNAFIRMVGVYPPGSVVQLSDDRYALVMTVNSARPLKPVLLVHDARVPREEALHLDLETAPALCIRRSVKLAQLPAQSLEYLAPRRRVAYFFDAAPEQLPASS